VETSEFKFLGYRISRVEFEIHENFYGKSAVRFIPTVDVKQNLFSENPRLVEVTLTVRVKNDSDTFSFHLEMKGAFEANKEMPDELFKQMYSINAPAILYPFARAMVTSFTAQANIPPVILPTANFTVPNKDALLQAAQEPEHNENSK